MPWYRCLLLILLLIAACKKTDLTVSQEHQSDIRPVGDFIRNNYDLSLLSAALQKTGLLDSLNGAGPFTIWTPDNKAFNGLGISRPEDFDSLDIDSLRYMMKYLIIPQRLYISDFPTQLDTRYATLSGGLQNVSVAALGNNADAFRIVVDGCTVYDAPKRNIALKNGVLHLLQTLPRYYPQKTIQDLLAADTSLSLFAALMKKSNQWDSLKLAGPYTVYAPVNSVFRRYGLTEDSIARLNVQRYKPLAFNIYTLSLKPHHLLSTDWGLAGGYNASIKLDGGYALAAGYYINVWAPGQRYGYHGPGGVNYADGQQGQNNMADNGVLFHISNVLLYPDSLLIK
jgi:uncharacterized surface protein with fasciclin (FAS1) repeats